jgi:hypothetical protein
MKLELSDGSVPPAVTWNFGDGGTGTNNPISHAWTASSGGGSYLVSAQVTGSALQAAATVSVLPPPTTPDTTPPTLALPTVPIAKAPYGSSGIAVNYPAPTARDDTDTKPQVTCSASPGNVFPIGKTTVTCTARDQSGNVSQPGSFVVQVDQAPAPAGYWVKVPAPISVGGTPGAFAGQSVAYTPPTATNGFTSFQVSCSPVSGATFPRGTTTVTCTSTGVSSSAKFTVTVVPPQTIPKSSPRLMVQQGDYSFWVLNKDFQISITHDARYVLVPTTMTVNIVSQRTDVQAWVVNGTDAGGVLTMTVHIQAPFWAFAPDIYYVGSATFRG